MKKGSITIFAALSIMLIASVLFVLLEGARNSQITRITKWNTDSAMESVFAGYNRQMWEQYHLLTLNGKGVDGIDPTDYETQVKELSKSSLHHKGLLSADTKEIMTLSYTLLTDGNGEAFKQVVSSYMKEFFLLETAKKIYNDYKVAEDIEKKYGGQGEEPEEAGNLTSKSVPQDLQGARSSPPVETGAENGKEPDGNEANGNKVDGNDGNGNETPGEEVENVVESVKEAKKSGILRLVLRNSDELSGAGIDLEKTLLRRNLAEGTSRAFTETIDNDLADRLLMEYYISLYFRHFTPKLEDDAAGLQYQMEYIIAGKKSDEENLKSVVYQMIAIREAANLMFLLTNEQKKAEALAVATLLAGISANEAVIKGVQAAILGAWAFAESVLDLRSLLHGEKVALIKTQQYWKSDIKGITKILFSDEKASNCPTGLSYGDYLIILLLKTNDKKTAFRTMDLMEQQITRLGNHPVRMDLQMVQMKMEISYEWESLFLPLGSISKQKNQKWERSDQKSYTYLRADP